MTIFRNIVCIVIFSLLAEVGFGQDTKTSIEKKIDLLIDYQTNHCYDVAYWQVLEKISLEGVGEGIIDIEKLRFFSSQKDINNETTPFPRINIFVGSPKLINVSISTESYKLYGKEFKDEHIYFAKVQYNVVGNWNYIEDQGVSAVFPAIQLVTTYYVFLKDPNDREFKLIDIFRPNARGHAFPVFRSLKEVVRTKRPEMGKNFVDQLSKQFSSLLAQ